MSRNLDVVAAILALAALALGAVALWVIWVTIKIRGSLRRTTGTDERQHRTTRLDAELYVETFRKRQEKRMEEANRRVL